MSTRKYLPREMEDFLRLLDGELAAPICVTVIGGAAIGLEYDTRHATTDIDVTPISNDLFWDAVARARARLIDPIPVQAVGLYAAPYDYEARRRPLAIAGLGHHPVHRRSPAPEPLGHLPDGQQRTDFTQSPVCPKCARLIGIGAFWPVRIGSGSRTDPRNIGPLRLHRTRADRIGYLQ
jgi:hypothetical protein